MPSGPCGGSRVPAESCEEFVWTLVKTALADPNIIAAEVRRLKEQGPDRSLCEQSEALQRTLAKIEKQQERLIRRFSEADDDSFPWSLVHSQITATENEKRQLRTKIAEISRRIVDQEATIGQLEKLETYCQWVRQNLAGFGFDEKRLALEALEIRVMANGSNPEDWDVTGKIRLAAAAGNGCQS